MGVGDALLAELPDREEPAGLASLVALHAVRLGHEGIAISRIGQDETGRVLAARLNELGVDVSHLQSDPDLATGRLVVRALGGARRLDAQVAYDNLQWDFDLADVAQRADAVVFGAMTRRTGQSRSATDRFLVQCEVALRVFDLTDPYGTPVVRAEAQSGLGMANAAVLDDAALRAVLPAADGRSSRDAASALLKQNALNLVVLAQEGAPLTALTAETTCESASAHRRDVHEATLVGLLHGLLAGAGLHDAVGLAERVGRHAREHPDEPPPPELLERA